MCHQPLAHHLNIVDILGYGWNMVGRQLSPFVAVEYVSCGSLRSYMKAKYRSIKTKMILIGDLATGQYFSRHDSPGSWC